MRSSWLHLSWRFWVSGGAGKNLGLDWKISQSLTETVVEAHAPVLLATQMGWANFRHWSGMTYAVGAPRGWGAGGTVKELPVACGGDAGGCVGAYHCCEGNGASSVVSSSGLTAPHGP